MAIPTTMTKDSIRAIIDGVENDPFAGMGCFTKKELLIDRLLAHSRTVQHVAGPVTAPAPVLTEVTYPDARKDNEVKPIKVA